MDLLEFEELRRSDTTDKLPFLDREKTHTHTRTPRMGQSKGQEAEKEMNELKHRTSKCRQTADEKTHVRKDSSLWPANIQKVRQVM